MNKALVGLVLVPLLAVPVHGGDPPKTVLETKGELTKEDKLDKVMSKSFHKVHELKLEGGKTDRIDLASAAFDTFLRLEDAGGNQLRSNDDNGESLNSRIVYTVPKEGGTFRVIVTTYAPGTTGESQLADREANRSD